MTESKKNIASYLEQVDRHVVQPEEYEDIPELDDAFFEHADFKIGGKLVRRGRPKAENPKQQITLRLDAEVLDGFRETGPGWQSRMNDALRRSLGLKAAKP